MPEHSAPQTEILPRGPETCLVTGCAGFMGSHLAQSLLGLGHRVVGVDNFFSGKAENMLAFKGHERFVLLQRSIAERGLWDEIFRQFAPVQTVFHLAAIVSVPYSMRHADETHDINFLSTERLLAAAEGHKVSRLVFAGSAAEYGAEERLPIQEGYATDETLQLSPYGKAKYLSSRAVGRSPLGVALRFFNVYGPRQNTASPYSGVISRFLSQALASEPLTIFGDGGQTRDFVFVHDAVQAYLTAAGLAGQRHLPAGTYNIGTGQAVTIMDLARTLLSLTDKPPRKGGSREHAAGLADRSLFSPAREGDIRHSVADVRAMTANSGWRPETGLSAGLAKTLAWQRQALAQEQRAQQGA